MATAVAHTATQAALVALPLSQQSISSLADASMVTVGMFIIDTVTA
jgi:hypothetical protein